MKYTRYDLKANKKKSEWKTMPILIVVVCILAIVIGTLIFKLVYPNVNLGEGTGAIGSLKKPPEGNQGGNNQTPPPVTTKEPEKKPAEEKVEDNSEKTEFLTVQFGYYSTKESATTAKTEISEKSFIIKDGEKFRVIGYIGKEENANKYAEKLKASGVECSKGKFPISKSEGCDKKIIELSNGFIDILDKALDKEVKSVKTLDFKDWSKAIEPCEGCKNIEVLKSFKGEIEKMPENVTADNVESLYQVLFDIFNKVK